jgi:hypothetical protein
MQEFGVHLSRWLLAPLACLQDAALQQAARYGAVYVAVLTVSTAWFSLALGLVRVPDE